MSDVDELDDLSWMDDGDDFPPHTCDRCGTVMDERPETDLPAHIKAMYAASGGIFRLRCPKCDPPVRKQAGRPARARATTGEPDTIPAWRVEIYWMSDIVGHLTGWLRAEDGEDEKTFRRKDEARAYAKRMTGYPALLVPYMRRKGVVVRTTRKRDWRDRLAAAWRDIRPATPEGKQP